MIENGYLCEPLAYRIKSKTDLSGVKTTAGEFNQRDLEETVNNEDRNEQIVKSYLRYCTGRKSCLVFASGISHIESLVEEFTKRGVYAKGLHSGKEHDKEYRKKVIEEFTSGKLPVLVNCGILTTGFDYEALDMLILGRPTQSRILYCQCLGRGLRTYPDKANCLIIDVVDVARRHDIIDMNSIFEADIQDGETLTGAKERKEKEEKEELMAKADAEEEERKRNEKLEIEAERIELFQQKEQDLYGKSKFDWYRCDNLTYALSLASDKHLVIVSINNQYELYHVSTEKTNKTKRLIQTFDEHLDALIYSAKQVNENNSFAKRSSGWKKDPATEAQLKYNRYAKTKWDAMKGFSSYNILQQFI